MSSKEKDALSHRVEHGSPGDHEPGEVGVLGAQELSEHVPLDPVERGVPGAAEYVVPEDTHDHGVTF